MQNLLNDLKTTLQSDERLIIDGQLVKNKIVELALAMDEGLIFLLLGNEAIKKHFFKDVSGVLVFDKVAFQRFVSNKQFLPDSYTAFKNKIGLTSNGEYLTESKEVVLTWPYKDCVLEGGQTKDDQKRKEIFWNETLAPDEIDRLLAPKVLSNFKKYDKDGEHGVESISLDDNLIIKGNNLLVLHSLKKQYAGKVKLIYIDPPYNTGSDSFGYNDSFNHSTWLTFMRNRLEVARDLLRDDGAIWINIDDDESHYLKVLCDEVFSRGNFIANIVWQKKYTISNDAEYFSDNHDHIIVIAKNKDMFVVNGIERTKEQNARYKNSDNDPNGAWMTQPLHAKSGNDNSFSYTFQNGVTWEPPRGTFPRYSKESLAKFESETRLWFGKDGKAVPRLKKYLKDMGSVRPATIWLHQEAGNNDEANKEVKQVVDNYNFSTPKPERLIRRILAIGSAENDLVLDFCSGSGTSGAVSHKMGRRYIGIEQMDYIHDVTCERLKKVIAGEQGGISKAVNWQGGGSFVYCELTQHNANIIDKIEQADTIGTLKSIWQEIENTDFISYKIKPETFNENIHEFEALSLEEQKQFLCAVLDKNQLYVNYSDIDDEDYQISEADKKLNKQFYGG
ncbi:MAG: site-specific DNA-methyltransferase [Proteobacteria bacterium]|nr:site-specific DNA-methyltransferase [Pseudomonadota bacterium]